MSSDCIAILPVPIGSQVWEVRDHYDNYLCRHNLHFERVEYQPFEEAIQAVNFNREKYLNWPVYFKDLEQAVTFLNNKYAGKRPWCVSWVDESYREELNELIRKKR